MQLSATTARTCLSAAIQKASTYMAAIMVTSLLCGCGDHGRHDATVGQNWIHFDLREVQVDISGLQSGVQVEQFDAFLFFGDWAKVGPNLKNSFEVMKIGGGKVGSVVVGIEELPGFTNGRRVTFTYTLPDAGTYSIRVRTDPYKFNFVVSSRLPDPLPGGFATYKLPPGLMTEATLGLWREVSFVRTVGSCPHVTAIYLDRKPANSMGEISRWSIELSEDVGDLANLGAEATVATGGAAFAKGAVGKMKSHPRVVEVSRAMK